MHPRENRRPPACLLASSLPPPPCRAPAMSQARQRSAPISAGAATKPAAKPTTKVAQRTVPNDFGGPIGTGSLIVLLPVIVASLYLFCNEEVGCSMFPTGGLSALSAAARTSIDSFMAKASWESFGTAWAIILGWFGFHVLLHYVLPGPVRKGIINDDGSQLSYRMNGMAEFFVSIGAVLAAHYVGIFDLTYLYREFAMLAVVAGIFAFLLAIYSYVYSVSVDCLKSHNGNSGVFIYDFFMGHALTPRLFGLDIKFFCEQRPGLIGWVVLDIACLLQQYRTFGAVTPGMALVTFLHGFYVFDTFLFEEAVLTTVDITTDGFGFMLSFGDLCWVPFTYSLQARFLAFAPESLSNIYYLVCLVVGVAGYLIFRFSNLEKHYFRHHPDHPRSKALKFMPTKSGSRLIISGWWGIARHINYFGDWVLGLAQCMATGYTHIIPYFFAFYFAGLLLHRERRDEAKCSAKYTDDWDRYCKLVPSRIIPGIY
ncbi:hypothetical protein H696_01906 [Fonticula alba]|uniref:Delta(14)-sterol reductase n=1 Tax=Fonticula alba TaxID=691883 RepID=A0A058Z9K5_FONAL|nr:hypothetical protein H696_01906 [Fonticula alba]KCV70959.1 hypothetical protein H696_01906 [Fonticula alba]|eukprot:XP_009494082.1 hypothetical protein H696_01906 [Fonticula alba]